MHKTSLQTGFEIVLSAALGVILLLHYLHHLSDLPALIMYAALAGTVPVIVGAVLDLWRGEWASMDMLASIALIFSLADHEWGPAAFIALMLATARLLSLYTATRAEKSIDSLFKLRPESARIERAGAIEIVPLEKVVPGDTVLLDVGERIPVDGVVVSGEAAVDESSLTGESLPVDKEKDSQVFSSTLVSSGGLRVRTERVGKDTTLEKIIELVKSARAKRPAIETAAERFGKAYLVGMIALSASLLYLTRDIHLVLSVVLVVCADDVAVAIPLAFMGAIGSAAKRGVVVKGSAHLEALRRATTFVFDKTGTLTTGKLTVSGISCTKGCDEGELLSYSALASRGSKHPLSRAITAYANERGIPPLTPDESHSVGGKGAIATYQGSRILIGRRAFMRSEKIEIPEEIEKAIASYGDEGKSISLTAKDGKILGIIALHDEIRPEAKDSLMALRELGAKRLVMLTGDNEHVARVVARELSIDEFHAGLMPQDKVARIESFVKEGSVVMVGDGVNDAAALSAATVGIAMGAIGYDTAIESASIVLMTDDLERMVETVRLSRRVQHIATEDFWIWGATNALGLALVFLGFIGPAGAAAYNFISDFFPLGNSVRAWFPARLSTKTR